MNAEDGRTSVTIDGKLCTLFVEPVMGQWYAVIVIGNDELLEDAYTQLAITIMVSIIIFCLISFFYYSSYKNERLYVKKVEEMNLQIVTTLATAIDAKDNYTNGHSSRVADYARMIAARTGHSPAEQDEIYMMGLLHDVGKIGVPDEVINKPSKLTDEEYAVIKKHSEIGAGILESIKERPGLAMVARSHHERYDGTGYPDQLSGENIPEEARIIAVADAYDAMTSRRSYREIMSQEKVLNEFRNGRGTQFDPKYADVMIELIKEDPDYNMREKCRISGDQS
ncbi:MAG: HD-GYP domain-containing protein [Lachnospiraceae bacterium]|nr:HD-GYP domain-containing protein [Lachnospiraceae bacterium]